ncbi:MAG: ATP-binding cassette domain-containing protein [Phycisphaerales bacterium]|nr:ATP-binding cassette domain-containing protein [Phycisphaerales bacterium]
MATPLPTMPIEISAQGLDKSFGEKIVLAGVDLTVRAGEIVAIVGASGSGKTVLLDVLAGLMAPSAGRVLAADHNRATTPVEGVEQPPLVDLAELGDQDLDLIRLHWAVVFQQNALFSGTVGQNLALWLREHTRLDAEEIERRCRAALKSVAMDPDEVIGKQRSELSGGMAKRAAIARAIACDPLVMFYDEPTTGLDPVIGAKIQDLIFATHNSPVGPGFEFRDLQGLPVAAPPRAGLGRTSIVVTHDRDLLRRIRPRVVMLHETRVCYDGPYESFGGDDCPPARAYLAIAPVLHAREAKA